jgi:hypothetical protein
VLIKVEVFATRDPATLGLTASLVGRLAAWQQWHESMGRLLASRVGQELPNATAWFYRDAGSDA